LKKFAATVFGAQLIAAALVEDAMPPDHRGAISHVVGGLLRPR
jgi:hypothetical protein